MVIDENPPLKGKTVSEGTEPANTAQVIRRLTAGPAHHAIKAPNEDLLKAAIEKLKAARVSTKDWEEIEALLKRHDKMAIAHFKDKIGHAALLLNTNYQSIEHIIASLPLWAAHVALQDWADHSKIALGIMAQKKDEPDDMFEAPSSESHTSLDQRKYYLSLRNIVKGKSNRFLKADSILLADLCSNDKDMTVVQRDFPDIFSSSDFHIELARKGKLELVETALRLRTNKEGVQSEVKDVALQAVNDIGREIESLEKDTHLSKGTPTELGAIDARKLRLIGPLFDDLSGSELQYDLLALVVTKENLIDIIAQYFLNKPESKIEHFLDALERKGKGPIVQRVLLEHSTN